MRLLGLGSVALTLGLAASAGSAAPDVATVSVRIAERACAVTPRTIPAGGTVFRIDNRSKRLGRFEIARRRSAPVRPGRRATLRLALPPGRHAYRCRPAGR